MADYQAAGSLAEKHKKKCPYCFRSFTNSDAAFFVKPSGLRFQSPALNSLIAQKRDLNYQYFWSSMGITEDQIDASRIVIDNTMMKVCNRELAATGREPAVKIYDPQSKGYSFQVREGGVSLYSKTMVCPWCHNILPRNFFRYELFMVGLAGSVASGKTVYLSSLIMNRYEVLQRENLTVRNASGNPGDEQGLEMERNADRLYRYGICPESTGKSFRKPLFLEMTYRTEERPHTILTAIYDVAGELMRDISGSGATGFVRHMNGYICMVDPAQMHLTHSVITKRIPDEERVLTRLHLMSRQEQITIQRMSNKNGKQVMDQSDYLIQDTAGEEMISECKADVILEGIRNITDDRDLRRKYMALTIAKSDLLEELGEIREYRGSELLFQRDEIRQGFLNMDRQFLRHNILKPIFDQKIYRIQKYLEDYREGGLFAVSALGCETVEKLEGTEKIIRAVSRVNPIRVEDPLLWMVMKYMRGRGWLE